MAGPTTVFVHLALDPFGAELLGRLRGFLEEGEPDTSAPRGAAVRDERHVYLWAGAGEMPSERSWWDRSYPSWLEALPLPGAEGRHATAEAVLADVARGVSGERIREIIARVPRDLLGPTRPFTVELTASASLADPYGGARLFGLLQGVDGLRRAGIVTRPMTVVAGLGRGTAPDTVTAGGESGTPLRDEQVRHVVAHTLEELQRWFGAGAASARATPMLLVGEDPPGRADTTPDRATQVAIGALGLLAATRSRLYSIPADPFSFSIRADGQVRQGRDPWDPARPFAVIGAGAVRSPARRFLGLAAARLCRELFQELGRQQPFPSLDHCARLDVSDERMSFLNQAEAEAIRHTWDAVAERERIPWDASEAAQDAFPWFPFAFVQSLYRPIFEERGWERMLDSYGEARIRALPLEDWNAALDELTLLIERGFVPRRQDQITMTTRRILRAFLDGLDHGAGRVFASTFQPPVDLEPNRMAAAMLGRVLVHLREEQKRLEKRLSLPVDRPESATPGRASHERAREALREALSAVASPAAVFLRLAPVLAAPVVLALALPLQLGFLDPTPWRLALGLLVGGASTALLFWRHVQQVRAELLARFRDWMERYRKVLELEDAKRRDDAYRDLLRNMTEVLEWAYNGVGAEPPLPKLQAVGMRGAEAGERPSEDGPEVVRSQSAISGFVPVLKRAAERYGELEAVLRRWFQVSGVETVLPEVHPDDDSVFDREYQRLLDATDVSEADWRASVRRERLLGFGHDLSAWCLKGSAGRASGHHMRPFAEVVHLRDDARSERTAWLRSFLLPSDEALLDSEVRASSSGFAFFDTVLEYLLGRAGGTFALTERLVAHRQVERAATVEQTELYRRLLAVQTPTVQIVGASSEALVLPCAVQDPLVAQVPSRCPVTTEHLSVTARITSSLSAIEVTYWPNEQAPRNLLGLAALACRDEPLAVEPLTGGGE